MSSQCQDHHWRSGAAAAAKSHNQDTAVSTLHLEPRNANATTVGSNASATADLLASIIVDENMQRPLPRLSATQLPLPRISTGHKATSVL